MQYAARPIWARSSSYVDVEEPTIPFQTDWFDAFLD
jgi:hypothetical protein